MGLDALRGFIIRVDYDRGKLAFLRSVPADAGHRVELDRVYGHIAIRATIGGSVRPLALDTGTRCYGSGILAKRDFDQLLEQGELSVVEKVPTWSDFGMAWHRAAVLRSRVSIAGFEHTALAFVESSQTSSDVCLLGTGFLRRYLVTFDFKSDSAYLAAGAQFHRVDASHDPGGVMLCRCPNGITVSHVARAAKAADVEVGDVLEIANGRRVDSLDEIELARILSTSDAPVTLNFRRANGRTIEFVYDEQAERRRSIDQFNARRGATK